MAKRKSPSTQAGKYVHEEIRHVRRSKHGARSTKQPVAIGLSKARRAGVRLKPPAPGRAKAKTRQSAARPFALGRAGKRRPLTTRSRAISRALRREARSAGTHRSLARKTPGAARTRGAAARHRASLKAVRTKGHADLRRAARKAARTRMAT